MQPVLKVVLRKGDLCRSVGVDALVTSANARLEGNANPSYWKHHGRTNVDGEVRRLAGPALNVACQIALQRDCDASAWAAHGLLVTDCFGELQTSTGCSTVVHVIMPDGLYGAPANSPGDVSNSSVSRLAPAAYQDAYAHAYSHAQVMYGRRWLGALRVAAARGASVVALPALGCGVQGWGAAAAAQLAARSTLAFAVEEATGVAEGQHTLPPPTLREVRIVLGASDVARAWGLVFAKEWSAAAADREAAAAARSPTLPPLPRLPELDVHEECLEMTNRGTL
jgi:O-acetyl-ADP-ribose deacetylase (regulator of RNase III)